MLDRVIAHARVPLAGFAAAMVVLTGLAVPETGAVAAPALAAPVPADLVGWLIGEFSNQHQVPTRGVPPGGDADHPQDRVHAILARVEVPALDGEVLYLQWHADDPQGPVIRQRLWSVVTTAGGPVLRFYTFRDATAVVDAHRHAARLRSLRLEDLISYPSTCDLPWTRLEDGRWRAAIPAACEIVAQQSGRRLRLEAEIVAGPEGFTYREAGYTVEGVQVFVVPRSGRYEFLRLKSPEAR